MESEEATCSEAGTFGPWTKCNGCSATRSKTNVRPDIEDYVQTRTCHVPLQMVHTMNGQLGVNAVQHVPVVLWFVPLNTSKVKCSDAIPPPVVPRDTGKNGDHGLAAVSHVVLVQ